MTASEIALATAAAALGGGLNAIAGGGSFQVFPALVLANLDEVTANATTTVALWPGTIASAAAYRRDLSGLRGPLLRYGTIGFFGGLVGALLLLKTPAPAFARLVPWLLLAAAAAFTWGPDFARRQGEHAAWATVFLTPVTVYGGYFGAGMGIVLLALFALAGMQDIHAMNGLKSAVAALVNLSAAATFVLAGAVSWSGLGFMIPAAIVGGYLAGRAAKRLPQAVIRRVVLCLAWGLAAAFFVRAFR